jgi:hypothetical protein
VSAFAVPAVDLEPKHDGLEWVDSRQSNLHPENDRFREIHE